MKLSPGPLFHDIPVGREAQEFSGHAGACGIEKIRTVAEMRERILVNPPTLQYNKNYILWPMQCSM